MTTNDNPVRYTGAGDVYTITLAGVVYSLSELEAALIIGRDAAAALGAARAAEGRLAARVWELERENKVLREALAFRQTQLAVALNPPSLVEAFAELRAAAGGAYDGVEADAFVRELRED